MLLVSDSSPGFRVFRTAGWETVRIGRMSMGNSSEPSEENRRRDLTSAPTQTPVWDSPWLRLAPWVVASALALTATWLAFQNLSLRTDHDNLLTERRLAEVASRTAQNQLAERSLFAETMINDLGSRLRRSENLARLQVSVLASPPGHTSEAQAIALWDPDQHTGLLSFEKLPALADEQDYQIWIVDPTHPNPVNGGVFHVATDSQAALAFKPDQPIKQATAFVISLEKKGGAPKAEGPIVLLGKLPGI
jgi:hypothetical protein